MLFYLQSPIASSPHAGAHNHQVLGAPSPRDRTRHGGSGQKPYLAMYYSCLLYIMHAPTPTPCMQLQDGSEPQSSGLMLALLRWVLTPVCRGFRGTQTNLHSPSMIHLAMLPPSCSEPGRADCSLPHPRGAPGHPAALGSSRA